MHTSIYLFVLSLSLLLLLNIWFLRIRFKPASEIDPVTQAINDLKKLSSNLKTTSKSSIKPNINVF